MQRTVLSVLTIGFLFVGVLSASQAQDRPEGGRSPELEREIEHLHKRLEDFQALRRRLEERDGSEAELAEVIGKIAGTQRELDVLLAQRAKRRDRRPEFGENAERLEAAARRIHHIRVAADNLEAAELHDLANELRERAEPMERDVQLARRRLAASREGDGLHGLVERLREEVEGLRDEVKELRREIGRR